MKGSFVRKTVIISFSVFLGSLLLLAGGAFELPALRDLARRGKPEELYATREGFRLLVGGVDVCSRRYAELMKLQSPLHIRSSSNGEGEIAISFQRGLVSFFSGGKAGSEEVASFGDFIPGEPIRVVIRGERAVVLLRRENPPYKTPVFNLRLKLINLIPTRTQARAVAMDDRRVFIAERRKLSVYRLESSSFELKPVLTFEPSWRADFRDLASAGNSLFVTDSNKGLMRLSLHDGKFELIEERSLRGAEVLAVRERLLFVSTGMGLVAYGIGEGGKLSESPLTAGALGLYRSIKDLHHISLSKDYLLAISKRRVWLVDISEPSKPTLCWSKANGAPDCGVVRGQYLYLGFRNGGLSVRTLLDPFDPPEVARLRGETAPLSVVDLAFGDAKLFLLDANYGLRRVSAEESGEVAVEGSVQVGGEPVSLAIEGQRCFAGLSPSGVLVLRREGQRLVKENFIQVGAQFSDMILDQGMLYLALLAPNPGLLIVEIWSGQRRYVSARTTTHILTRDHLIYTSGGEVYDPATDELSRYETRGVPAFWGDALVVASQFIDEKSGPGGVVLSILTGGRYPQILASTKPIAEFGFISELVIMHPFAVVVSQTRGLGLFKLGENSIRFLGRFGEQVKFPVCADSYGSYILIGDQSGNLWLIDLGQLNDTVVSKTELPSTSAVRIRITGREAYVLTGDSLRVYSLPSPSEVPLEKPVLERASR